MKVDPFAPQLLRDYADFTSKHGPFPFGEYMARWYAAQALIEAAEEEGRDPFQITPAELSALFPESVN